VENDSLPTNMLSVSGASFEKTNTFILSWALVMQKTLIEQFRCKNERTVFVLGLEL